MGLGGGTLYGISDTSSYLRAGSAIAHSLGSITASTGKDGPLAADALPDAKDTAVSQDDDGKAPIGRSLTYPLLFYPVHSLMGAGAFAPIQTWIVVFIGFAFVSGAALCQWRILVTGLVGLAAFSTLPWTAVSLVPDLLAGGPILFAGVLAARWDRLNGWQKIALTILAAYTASTHYGTMPLAAGAVSIAVIVRIWSTRRLAPDVLAAAVVVAVTGPLLNLAASSATMREASVAPLHLPILLARSIEDGPARWYLQDACPEANLTLCRLLGDDMPDNVGAFLWSSSGIDKATPEQMEQIRREETEVLWRAFLAYPAAQTQSLLGNAGKQFVTIGILMLEPFEHVGPGMDLVKTARSGEVRDTMAAIDRIVIPATWILLVIGLALAARVRIERAGWIALLVVGVGLLGNAVIFGGLSAPVPRYQARVIWIPLFLIIVFVAEARGLAYRRRSA